MRDSDSDNTDPFRHVTAEWLAGELKAERVITDWTDVDGSLDVRLQVYPDGTACLRSGSSDYDQDHHGYWGAGIIASTDDASELLATAEDLIEQAREQHAMEEGLSME